MVGKPKRNKSDEVCSQPADAKSLEDDGCLSIQAQKNKPEGPKRQTKPRAGSEKVKDIVKLPLGNSESTLQKFEDVNFDMLTGTVEGDHGLPRDKKIKTKHDNGKPVLA